MTTETFNTFEMVKIKDIAYNTPFRLFPDKKRMPFIKMCYDRAEKKYIIAPIKIDENKNIYIGQNIYKNGDINVFKIKHITQDIFMEYLLKHRRKFTDLKVSIFTREIQNKLNGT